MVRIHILNIFLSQSLWELGLATVAETSSSLMIDTLSADNFVDDALENIAVVQSRRHDCRRGTPGGVRYMDSRIQMPVPRRLL